MASGATANTFQSKIATTTYLENQNDREWYNWKYINWNIYNWKSMFKSLYCTYASSQSMIDVVSVTPANFNLISPLQVTIAYRNKTQTATKKKSLSIRSNLIQQIFAIIFFFISQFISLTYVVRFVDKCVFVLFKNYTYIWYT